MTCVSCGQSAIGKATNGDPYCHRKTCICWRSESIKAQAKRDANVQLLVAWAKRHSLWGF